MNITITLSQDEIHDALKDFMVKHDVVTANKEIDINLVAGRGPAGFSAVISISGTIQEGIVPNKPVARESLLELTPDAEPEPPVQEPRVQKQDLPEPEAPPVEKEKKTRAKKEKPAEALSPFDSMEGSIHDDSDELPPGPTPEVAAAADKLLDNLFSEEASNTLVEETDSPFGGDDAGNDALFGNN